jgi:tRNA G10  N-methylase Trm11
MKKAEKLAAFEDIDAYVLNGSRKNKEIVKLFLTGMTNREIAELYGLSASRIGQITDKQARRAISYKKTLNDHDYQALVEVYIEKIERGETILIDSEINDKIKHMNAVSEARKRLTEKEEIK